MEKEEILKRAKDYIAAEKDERFRKEVEELIAKEDYKELEDRFYQTLEFGTGGLRGIMGGGTNRMNTLEINMATQGMNPGIGFRIALRWSNSSRRSHGRKYEEYLGDDKEDIIVFCHKQLRQKGYDYFVFGHRHLPIVKVIEETSCPCDTKAEDRQATYVNVGNWIDHRDYAVFDGSTLQTKTFAPDQK